MKFNYLFVNQNNGHFKTYHPFVSNNVLHQERVTEWLMQIPGATRMGTSLDDLLDRLAREKISFEKFKCPCCDTLIHQLNIIKDSDFRRWQAVCGISWILLDGVSGNY